jgi:hypothetical protein
LGRIANTSHGEDQLGVAGVGFELAAKTGNVYINNPEVSRTPGRITPELFKNFGPRHHMTRLAKQQFKKAEFCVSEGDAFGSTVHLTAIGINH